MPQYIILRRKKDKVIMIGVIPHVRSIRAAFTYFKKNFKRRLHKDWEYHLYPVNHARYWTFENGKWVIGSWYGNHTNEHRYDPIPNTR